MPFIAFQTISFKTLWTDATKPLNFNKHQSQTVQVIKFKYIYIYILHEKLVGHGFTFLSN